MSIFLRIGAWIPATSRQIKEKTGVKGAFTPVFSFSGVGLRPAFKGSVRHPTSVSGQCHQANIIMPKAVGGAKTQRSEIGWFLLRGQFSPLRGDDLFHRFHFASSDLPAPTLDSKIPENIQLIIGEFRLRFIFVFRLFYLNENSLQYILGFEFVRCDLCRNNAHDRAFQPTPSNQFRNLLRRL